MQLHEVLTQLDGLLDQVSAIVAENNPETTEQALVQLRDSMAAFNDMARRYGPAAFTPANIAHMQRISGRLGMLRGHISRMGAITAQQLATLMPQQGSAHTYGTSSQPPGAAVSIARLYHVSG